MNILCLVLGHKRGEKLTATICERCRRVLTDKPRAIVTVDIDEARKQLADKIDPPK